MKTLHNFDNILNFQANFLFRVNFQLLEWATQILQIWVFLFRFINNVFIDSLFSSNKSGECSNVEKKEKEKKEIWLRVCERISKVMIEIANFSLSFFVFISSFATSRRFIFPFSINKVATTVVYCSGAVSVVILTVRAWFHTPFVNTHKKKRNK